MKARCYHLHCVAGLAVIFVLFPATVQAQLSVLTWHNNNLRTGLNWHETILTPSNVNSTQFGKIFTLNVDGQIFAQPLYVANRTIPGKGTHNVVYVATENDSVYAFDADTPGPPLWRARFTNPAKGITAVPCADVSICSKISPTVGITATPVIDLTSNTLYVVAFTKENGSYIDRLHALNITTGAEKFGGPVVIEASVPGTGAGSVNGMVAWNAQYQLTRAALLLLNGVVYIGSASFAHDQGPYHGWLLGYSAGTLVQVAVFNTSPNAKKAGIWGPGAGPAAAPLANFLIVSTANGVFDVDTGGVDYGDSFLKLGTTGGLSVLDYFTPYNQLTLRLEDLDLNAGGVMMLPANVSGKHREVMGAGKQDIIYVINVANMGKYDPNGDHVVQEVMGSNSTCPGGTGTPAYFNNAVYFSGCNDSLKMFSVTNGLLSTSPVSESLLVYVTGATPSISANGSVNGIVWAIKFLTGKNASSRLDAYNASDLTDLYNTKENPTRDVLPPTYFAVPTVANGKVYIGTLSGLVVYGLL